jgi:hypothetical protein
MCMLAVGMGRAVDARYFSGVRFAPVAALCLASIGCANLVGDPDDLGTSTASTAGGAAAGGAGGGGPGGGPTQCVGDVLWAHQLGDASDQTGRRVAAGPDGSVFLGGHFYGAIALGDDAIVSEDGVDIFLARLDGDGTPIWTRPIGGDGDNDGAVRIAADPEGGVVLAGSFTGTVDLGGGPFSSPNDDDAFVARYDGAGNHLWSKHYDTTASEKVLAVALDPLNGDVLLAGNDSGPVDFGGGDVAFAGGLDGFVVRLDPSGNHLWSRGFGGPFGDFITSVAVDDVGRVAFGGGARTGIDLGEGLEPHQGDGSRDAFIALYDQRMMPIWAHTFPDPGEEEVGHVVDDGSGVVFSGSFESSIDLGGPRPLYGPSGLFVGKYDSLEQHVANVAFVGLDGPDGLASDGTSGAAVSGRFELQVDAGGTTLYANGGTDALALVLGPGLETEGTLHVGSTDDDDAPGIALDSSGNAFVLINFRDTVVVPGCGSFTSAGGSDVLLLKRAP